MSVCMTTTRTISQSPALPTNPSTTTRREGGDTDRHVKMGEDIYIYIYIYERERDNESAGVHSYSGDGEDNKEP